MVYKEGIVEEAKYWERELEDREKGMNVAPQLLLIMVCL